LEPSCRAFSGQRKAFCAFAWASSLALCSASTVTKTAWISASGALFLTALRKAASASFAEEQARHAGRNHQARREEGQRDHENRGQLPGAPKPPRRPPPRARRAPAITASRADSMALFFSEMAAHAASFVTTSCSRNVSYHRLRVGNLPSRRQQARRGLIRHQPAPARLAHPSTELAKINMLARTILKPWFAFASRSGHPCPS